MEFDTDLDGLRELKQQIESDIEELEEKVAQKSSNTKRIRRSLAQLKESLETGEIPDDEKDDTPTSVRDIPRVTVNPDTGKPPRGARGNQIERAIEVVSRRQDTFEAKDLFELLQEADPNFDQNQRDYMYSKLNSLKDEGRLEKVKRGTWTIDDW